VADAEAATGDIIVRRADDPRTLARDGLLGLGLSPAEAEELLARVEGETPEDLIAASLRLARGLPQ